MVRTVKLPTNSNAPTQDDDATIVVTEKPNVPLIQGYQITQHIGAGGMADVWLGTDNNLKREAAVKTMSSELVKDPEFIQRFAEEAQIVAGFRHPNIVTVFASGQSDEHYWIAMEYISGGTLGEKIQRGALPIDEALPIAQAMAEALAYSHDHGIIHRDFKPGNVLFTADGTPVLSDFGIAKSTEIAEGDGLTVPGLIIGSPRYMAPEQLLGKHTTAKADVYALGLVLYEMLSQDVPAPDQAMISSEQQIAELGKGLPGIDKVVLNIIADCLREAPQERATAAAIAERLQAYIQGTSKSRSTLWVGLGTIAVVAVLVLTTQLGDTTRQLEITAEPTTAKLYLDGQFIEQGANPLGAGAHTLVVVEPNHFGQVVRLAEDLEQPVSLSLKPITDPDFETFSTFSRLFGDETPTADIDPNAVNYPPFKQLLKLRLYQRTNNTAASEALRTDLNALAAAGDPAAQVVLYVANFDAVIEGDRFSGLIQQASNSGFGLATFYQALHYQWAKSGDNGMDLSALQVYRSLMALAQQQGLRFAGDYVQQADALLETN